MNTVILNRRECVRRLGQNGRWVHENSLCTTNQRNTGVCGGDAGSPLKTQDFTEILIGVVSWKVPCARGYPDVYTRVYPHMQFIRRAMRDWLLSFDVNKLIEWVSDKEIRFVCSLHSKFLNKDHKGVLKSQSDYNKTTRTQLNGRVSHNISVKGTKWMIHDSAQCFPTVKYLTCLLPSPKPSNYWVDMITNDLWGQILNIRKTHTTNAYH